jgi:hypothetical protein
MSIEQLGSLGELIAAVATVITLAYLAFQIRQGARTIRATSTTAHVAALGDLTLTLGKSQELSELYFRGLASIDNVPPEQRNQFDMLVSAFLLQLQREYLLQEEGVVHNELAEWNRATLTWLASQSGFRDYWQSWKNTHPPAFQVYVNREISKADKASS